MINSQTLVTTGSSEDWKGNSTMFSCFYSRNGEIYARVFRLYQPVLCGIEVTDTCYPQETVNSTDKTTLKDEHLNPHSALNLHNITDRKQPHKYLDCSETE